MASKSSGPEDGEVKVKFLPKDPLVARRDDLWEVEADIKCPTPGSGPSGPHSVVVDYNADLDERFAPAFYQKSSRNFRGLARLSGEKLLADFHFHQVNVWAVVEQTLAKIEHPYVLGRAVPWASGAGRLLLLPHASYMQNAFYDRSTGALHFGYCEGFDGKPVYTCLSHDIIAHELGHAVLDGLKPYYNEVSSPQTAGFHEFFGDALAMMAGLSTRKTALEVVKKAPRKLDPHNIVSAIASEFGAVVREVPADQYLRGAWNDRKMDSLAGTFGEHTWSEVLTGIYYDLLEFLYPRALRDLEREFDGPKDDGTPKDHSMRALIRAANATASVMFRGLDYCPPVDLQYDEYARGVLRAQEVAYPIDDAGIGAKVAALFARRGIGLPADESAMRKQVRFELRHIDISVSAGTPADAYRFLDCYRTLFGLPYEANLSVVGVYRTNKKTTSGYRPPREHIIEFVWSEDVRLVGERFGDLRDTLMPLWCGGTLVFDAAGNFLHSALVRDTPQRRTALKDYVAWMVSEGYLTVADGVKGIGAPATGRASVRATAVGGRTRLERIAAARHCGAEDHT